MAEKTNDRRAEFVAQAESHVGYISRPGMQSQYGGMVGYTGLPWAGAFVDVVAREAGVEVPACVYPPSGLAEFIKQRRWHFKPQPGDIAFFTFSTVDDFGLPHVGIVVDTSEWRANGWLTTVEGQVANGFPRSQQSNDGVYKRIRWNHDIIGFGRPNFNHRHGALIRFQTGKTEVSLTHCRPGAKPNGSVERVQLALSLKTGLATNVKRGSWDKHTGAAYSRWQRMCGFVGANVTGIPDRASLERLGRETGYFSVKE